MSTRQAPYPKTVSIYMGRCLMVCLYTCNSFNFLFTYPDQNLHLGLFLWLDSCTQERIKCETLGNKLLVAAEHGLQNHELLQSTWNLSTGQSYSTGQHLIPDSACISETSLLSVPCQVSEYCLCSKFERICWGDQALWLNVFILYKLWAILLICGSLYQLILLSKIIIQYISRILY